MKEKEKQDEMKKKNKVVVHWLDHQLMFNHLGTFM